MFQPAQPAKLDHMIRDQTQAGIFDHALSELSRVVSADFLGLCLKRERRFSETAFHASGTLVRMTVWPQVGSRENFPLWALKGGKTESGNV